MSALPFAISYLIPISVLFGVILGGWFTFFTPIVVFVIVPILDSIVGRTTHNPSGEEEASLAEQSDFKQIVWFSVPTLYALVFWGAYLVTHQTQSWVEIIGITLSVGIATGAMGITLAHELVHRIDNKFEPMLGRMLLLLVSYTHWGLEHIAGHHRNVATPHDPATAKLGQSYYQFWTQTVFGSFTSAWRIQKEKLKRKNQAVWGLKNEVLRWLFFNILLITAFYLLFGLKGAVFYLAQSIIAFSLLESVNYLEHYGLERRQLADGSYERVTHLHSWNNSNLLTNYFLINLQRHSDHHAKPNRRYQLLRHHNDSPQLPVGYATLVPLTLIPPLWRRVMDKRVLAYQTFLRSRFK